MVQIQDQDDTIIARTTVLARGTARGSTTTTTTTITTNSSAKEQHQHQHQQQQQSYHDHHDHRHHHDRSKQHPERIGIVLSKRKRTSPSPSTSTTTTTTIVRKDGTTATATSISNIHNNAFVGFTNTDFPPLAVPVAPVASKAAVASVAVSATKAATTETTNITATNSSSSTSLSMNSTSFPSKSNSNSNSGSNDIHMPSPVSLYENGGSKIKMMNSNDNIYNNNYNSYANTNSNNNHYNSFSSTRNAPKFLLLPQKKSVQSHNNNNNSNNNSNNNNNTNTNTNTNSACITSILRPTVQEFIPKQQSQLPLQQQQQPQGHTTPPTSSSTSTSRTTTTITTTTRSTATSIALFHSTDFPTLTNTSTTTTSTNTATIPTSTTNVTRSNIIPSSKDIKGTSNKTTTTDKNRNNNHQLQHKQQQIGSKKKVIKSNTNNSNMNNTVKATSTVLSTDTFDKSVSILSSDSIQKQQQQQQQQLPQFDLLRLYQKNTNVSTNSNNTTTKNNKTSGGNGTNSSNTGGLIRISKNGIKKKKFSSLKKKVLEERLHQWQMRNGTTSTEIEAVAATSTTTTTALLQNDSTSRIVTTVCLFGFAYDTEDDDDEYNELIDHLTNMAIKIAPVKRIYIPRRQQLTNSYDDQHHQHHDITTTEATVKATCSDDNDNDIITNWPAFVEFDIESTNVNTKNTLSTATTSVNNNSVMAAVQCWNNLVLGGQNITCQIVVIHSNDNNKNHFIDMEENVWRRECIEYVRTQYGGIEQKIYNDFANTNDVRDTTTNEANDKRIIVQLGNVITDDDLDDEMCLAESLNDLKELASQYGKVMDITVNQLTDPNATKSFDCSDYKVHIHYGTIQEAQMAVTGFDGMLIGGQALLATIVDITASNDEIANEECTDHIVNLCNIITEDDLEDETCLEESLNDIKEIALQFGTVLNVYINPPIDPDATKTIDCSEYRVQLHYKTISEAHSARRGFDGMMIGGQSVVATIDESTVHNKSTSSGRSNTISLSNNTNTSKSKPEPMYSGDKLIPERFAACKRVPKIVNTEPGTEGTMTTAATSTRVYAKLANDATIKDMIVEMLLELMRLQRRAIEENNTKAKRRLVMGLREVARGIRSHKVKLVIMANNLDNYGVIDQTVQDIIDLAKNEEVPIYYELTKKSLGKAVHKSIKVAVVGVQNADGAHQQYKKLMSYATANNF